MEGRHTRERACAVGRAVLGYGAFGRTKRGRKKDEVRVLNMPSFIDANNLQPFISKDLRGVLNQIEYENLKGQLVTGYDAKILPLICDVYLTARSDDKLTKHQLPLAAASEILIRSFAQIGIIALIDEATGFQEIRDRKALQAILDKYLRKELATWAKRFPDEFYMQIFRLKGWQWKGMRVNRPSVVGRYTQDIVYERLAPGILEELEKRNPRGEKGSRPSKHHQWLTEDIGHPALAQHLHAAIGLLRASTSWDQFNRMLQRAFPKKMETLPLLTDE